MDKVTTLDLEQYKAYTYAEELKRILDKLNEVINYVNNGDVPQDVIDEIENNIAVLQSYFTDGKANEALSADSADSIGEYTETDIETALTNIATLLDYFTTLGVAKKASQLWYKDVLNVAHYIQWDPVNDRWVITDTSNNPNGKLYVKTLQSDITTQLSQDLDYDETLIDWLNDRFQQTGEAKFAEVAFELLKEGTSHRVYHDSNGWHFVGDIYAPSSDLTVSAINADELTLSDLDTTDPHVAGKVWNDSGTLKISNG